MLQGKYGLTRDPKLTIYYAGIWQHTYRNRYTLTVGHDPSTDGITFHGAHRDDCIRLEDNNGQPAPVTGFGIGSLITDAGGELFNFRSVSASRYTVDVRFIKRTDLGQSPSEKIQRQ